MKKVFWEDKFKPLAQGEIKDLFMECSKQNKTKQKTMLRWESIHAETTEIKRREWDGRREEVGEGRALKNSVFF